MKKVDRFDLEQQIMDCWRVTDDIDSITEYFGDHVDFKDMPPEYADKIMNIMIGIGALYNVKFDKLFRTFEALVHEGVIDDRNRCVYTNPNRDLFDC